MQGELGSRVFTSFAAAKASYMDGVPWLEAVAWALWWCLQVTGSALCNHWASEEQCENR